MLDDYGFEIYEENEFPLAYLITFRTYGTWLHGDRRTSVNRSNRNIQGTIKIDPNVPLEEAMQDEMDRPLFILSDVQRKVVHDAIEELCHQRTYALHALNVRTNHAHSVVGAQKKPERVADSLKAFSTKRLRELGLIAPDERVWSRGRSRRYLWKPRDVEAAVHYVLHCQDDVPFDDWNG
jgi:REP element-mobilizing transposase RayT